MKLLIKSQLRLCCNYLLFAIFYFPSLSICSAQSSKSSQPLNIISVSDTTTRTLCTYNCKITINYKFTDENSVNYVFDSVWILTSIPDRNRTFITKHFVNSIGFKSNNTNSVIINYKRRIGNEGMIAEPRNCDLVPYLTNIKFGDVRFLTPETVRLYYTYKGKYKIARFYKPIENRLTIEEQRKITKRNQMYKGDRE